ncbi:molybdopterin-dependent oxidoreductase [Acidovorax sp. D2M1]|uniref:Molybdopterin-dependent oxidoreductase n=1 Tax=Acidovorax benzenivorans TaxID=2987520 RepID=A0ABT5S1Y2_9BURK|nr:molybdopterin-dependent oxidoreductase [Acidovorax benzenivorans]MDD2179138.1 molybdopterin-dependent oxidoreductase [Acidovorax benzenivorans]
MQSHRRYGLELALSKAFAVLATWVVGAAALAASTAQALEPPTGPVVLTIDGAITQTNRGAQAQFDMKMLEKLPQHSFSTQTPWYPSAVTFTGPLLRDVLAAVGAKGTKITAVALNDYKTEIPADDATRHDVIVARLMNNRPMPIREKGPLFIVFPFDAKAELRSELYYNRAAWQLNALHIR